MQDKDNFKISSVIFRRKLLQISSSSPSSTTTTTFDTSQPSFIALLCIISILTCALVIITSFLCYRYYSHRERRLRRRRKQHNRSERIFPPEQNPPSNIIPPVSITPTSASSYSFRSSDQLVSNHHQQRSTSIDTLPSRRLQQSVLDAYLNDLNTYQPTVMDVRQLSHFLFVDLHSTSSETYPETNSKSPTQTVQSNTATETRHQIKSRSTLIKNSRFVMRERTLPTKLTKLPQLRPIITQEEKDFFGFDDSNNSSTINRNHELLSTTTTTTTTDDYDDSHAYNVNKHQILQSIKEEQPFFTEQHFPSVSLRYEQDPYCFEIVSTTHDDSSEIRFPYQLNSIQNNNFAYMNDSIVV